MRSAGLFLTSMGTSWLVAGCAPRRAGAPDSDATTSTGRAEPKRITIAILREPPVVYGRRSVPKRPLLGHRGRGLT